MAPGRSKKKLSRLVLQPRDFDLAETLGTAGTLDTNVIWRRHFSDDRTGQSCRRRLNLLAKHGFVQRTFIEVSSARGNGRAPILYNLTPKGAKAVEDERGICKLRTSYGDRLSPKTIRHRAGIGELVLSITDACRAANIPDPQWLLEYDTQQEVPKGSPFSRRFHLCQEFKGKQGGRLTCWPDLACQIALPSAKEQANLALIFEYDRSTEDHPQLLDKLPPYELLFAKRSYRQWWPKAVDAYLFFVFQTEIRLRNAAETFTGQKLAPRIRMAVVADLQSQSPVTESVWLTVGLERRALLRPSSAAVIKSSSS